MERATTADSATRNSPRMSGLTMLPSNKGGDLANLPNQCDSCGADLMLEHALSCKKGGLIGIRHNDVRDKWAHLCGIALTNL
ncbi:hypothetical protein ACHAW6_000482 [Cyclotella cf. meneghiniana]